MSKIKKLLERKVRLNLADVKELTKLIEGKVDVGELFTYVKDIIGEIDLTTPISDQISLINAQGTLLNKILGLGLTDEQKDKLLVEFKNKAYKIAKARKDAFTADPTATGKLPQVCSVRYDEGRVITEQFLLEREAIFGQKNLLLIIDMQNDFASHGGSLYVMGGEEANANLISFIRLNRKKISEILLTRDDHYHTQIGMSHAWLDKNNRLVDPFTKITALQVEKGEYKPRYMEKQYAITYLKAIEAKGAQHTLWPNHCIHGSYGQQFSGELIQALQEWSEVHNGLHYKTVDKGYRDEAEMYSVFSYADGSFPEFRKNLLDNIANAGFDKIFIAGLAKDICVAESVKDLVEDGRFKNKLVFLNHCMTSINNKATSLKIYDKAIKDYGAQYYKG